MNFLGNLGVDIWLLIAQIINFIFLMWVLTKLVYKPLIKRIEEDEAAFAEVKKAREELEKREKQIEHKERLYIKNTKNKAKAILSEAEEIAESIKKKAQTETVLEKKAVMQQVNQRLAEISHGDS